jgi:hypothetical protein
MSLLSFPYRVTVRGWKIWLVAEHQPMGKGDGGACGVVGFFFDALGSQALEAITPQFSLSNDDEGVEVHFT